MSTELMAVACYAISEWVVRRFSVALVLLGCFTLSWVTSAAGQPTVAYRVTITTAGDAVAAVEMTVRDLANRSTLEVALPAWTPGSYEILNHAKHLFDLTASTPDGRPLPIRRRDKQTWRVVCRQESTVVLRYRILCERQSVDANWLGETYGQLVGAATFLYLPDGRSVPATLALQLPLGWEAATPLDRRPNGDYVADNYDALIDAPLVVGQLTRLDFTVRDKPISIVLTHRPKDPAGLQTAVAKIVEAYADLMGGLPFKRYMVQYIPFEDEDEERLEGLEHANGTLINYAPATLLDNPRAKSLLAVTAHEIFHAWNVKRLKPCEFADYPLDRELYTPQLWFVEGVTEYYAWRGLRRAGLVSAEDWDEAVQIALSDVINNPAAKSVSLTDASLATWLVGTSNFEDIPLDYYRKGFVVALMLDVELRVRTANARGLDDLLRQLLAEFPEEGPGYCADDIVRLAGELAGRDLAPFFHRFVEGTDELPIDAVLAPAGLSVLIEPLTELDFGFELAPTSAGLVIAEIDPDGPAGKSELEEGDLLRTVAGRPVRSEDEVGAAFARLRPNTPVKLVVLRDKRLITVTIVPEAVTTLDVAVAPLSLPTPEQKAIRVALRGAE